MKTLKTIIACLIMALSCATFVGCDKEKDSDSNGGSNSIVGTWRYSDGDCEDIYVFKSNGTYENRFTPRVYEKTYVYYGTYQYQPPYLTFHEDGDSWVVSVSINGNTMTMDGDVYYRQ